MPKRFMIRENKDTFCGRLGHLMLSHNPKITEPIELSRLMYKKGILTFEANTRDGRSKSEEENINYTKDTILQHLKCRPFNKISSEWLIRYCKFFDCSADYLLGIIDEPTHNLSNIHDLTGLSEYAIKKLHSAYEERDSMGDTLDRILFTKIIEKESIITSKLLSDNIYIDILSEIRELLYAASNCEILDCYIQKLNLNCTDPCKIGASKDYNMYETHFLSASKYEALRLFSLFLDKLIEEEKATIKNMDNDKIEESFSTLISSKLTFGKRDQRAWLSNKDENIIINPEDIRLY